MKRIILSCLFLFLLFNSAWALPQPQEQVATMVDSIMGILQQSELSIEEKKDQVSGRVQQYLNMASMSQRTLGKYWHDATEEQRQRFSNLFVQVLEGIYLNRINDYSGGKVEYLKQRVKGRKAIIDTRFVSEDLEIPVQYKMIFVEDNWQVFDVVIEGVSLIRNYRSSYNEIIRNEGYEGLFLKMEAKIQVIQAGLKNH